MSIPQPADTCALVALLMMQFVTPACGDDSDPKRWAIVASAAIRESGLSDLLLVDLSSLPDIKLVEREQIEAATRELELAEILSPTGVRTRAGLGKLLGADVLLMLNLERSGKEQILRIVISDCKLGTRLWMDVLPFPGPGVEANAQLVLEAARKTQARFPGGVQSIVAVPQFVSHTLVHDYDYLQSTFARLAESAAWSVPNLAVVETEEASAIRKERELSGAGGVARVVALFLEGEYEESEAPADGQPKVKLKLSARDATHVLGTFESHQVPLAEVPGLLREQVLKTLSIPTKQQTAISVPQQFKLLAERADTFTRAGSLEHSTALRESCLLLEPAAVEQRKYVLEEYLRMLDSYPDAQKMRDLPPAKVDELTSAYLAQWRRIMVHLEFVIRNRALVANLAISFSHRVAQMVDNQKWTCPASMRKDLARAEHEMRTFIKTAYPLVLRLEVGNAYLSPEEFIQSWQRLWLAPELKSFPEPNELDAHMKWRSLDAGSFTALVGAIENNPAPRAIIDGDVLFLLEQAAQRVEGPGKTGLANALESLKKSSRPLSRLYGRCGLLLLRFASIRQLSNQGISVDGQELASFLTEARECEKALQAFVPPGRLAGALRPVVSVCRQAERMAAAITAKEPTRPIPAPGSRPTPASDAPGSEPSLTYELVQFQVRKLSGEQLPLAQHQWAASGPNHILGIVPCEDRFDVLWGPFAVLFHEEPRIAKEVLVDSKAKIHGVAWDGLYVWVANLQEGLVLLDRAGKQAARVTRSHGLPPCEGSIQLFPLSPGRVFAVGRFGQPLRAWCAIVEWQNGKPRVNVFHHATRHLAPGDAPVEPWKDATLAFAFGRILQLGPADPDGNRTLVIPRSATPPLDFRGYPLVIDTRVAKATVAAHFYPQVPILLLPDGSYLEGTSGLTHCAAPGSRFEDGSTSHQLSKLQRSWYLENAVLYADNAYLPGNEWYRLKLKAFKLEHISEGPLPSGMKLNAYYSNFFRGVSSHFGLLMWNHEQRFCKIKLSEPSGSSGPQG